MEVFVNLYGGVVDLDWCCFGDVVLNVGEGFEVFIVIVVCLWVV